MADRHTDDREPDAKRRTLLRAVGTAGALALGGMSTGNAAASNHDVNLADEGLSSGDQIDSYLDGSFSDETVLIPAGEYQWDGTLPSLSNATLQGHPDGVVFHRPSSDEQVRSTLPYSGESTLANVTIRGQSGSRQSRIDLQGSSGSHLTLRNVNLPDGSVDYSDSYAFSAWDGAGDVTFERCYLGDFGNAACYMEGNDGNAEWRECVIINAQNSIRPPENHDGLVEDCVFIWQGESTHFCEDPQAEPASSCGECGGSCGRMARAMRIKHPIDTLEVRRCRFYMGEGDISYGPSIDLREEGSANSIIIDDCRFYNHGDVMPISARGSIGDVVEATNLRDGGPGAGLDDFADARVGNWDNPDLSDVSVWHTGDGTRSASVSAADPTPNTPEESGNGDEEDENDPFEDRFVVVGTTTNEALSYRFWVDGTVSLATTPQSDLVAETGDEQIDSADDLAVVTGSTGNGYGDAFSVDGEVLAFERTGGNSDWELFDDGDDVTDEIPGSLPDEQDPLDGSFAVMSTTPNEEVQYTFWADGDVSLVTDVDEQYAAESDEDEVSQEAGYTVVTGSTADEFGDTFVVDGDVVAFQQTGGNSGYQLLDDGQDVTEDVPTESPIDEDEGGNDTENRLVVMATTPQEEIVYQFWVDGDVSLDTDADDGTAAETGDEQMDEDGDFVAVTGSTGNEYGDAFLLDGDVVAFARTGGESDYELLLGGDQITDDVPEAPPDEEPPDDDPPDDEPSSGTILIDGTEAPDETAQYTFTVSDTVEVDSDNSTVAGDNLPWDTMDDSVGDGTATGIVGNGVDAYAITGELEEIDIRGPAEYTIEWS